MMDDEQPTGSPGEPAPSKANNESFADRLSRLEDRISRIEEYLRLSTPGDDQEGNPQADSARAAQREEELEFELGQNLFAKVGIGVIAVGIAFLLTFPYGSLPPAAPGLFGIALAGGIFLLARLWRDTFDLVSRYLRGAGIALLFFATLRLFFFGREPALASSSAGGIALVVLVLAINVLVALRRHSPYLLGLAITTGFATAIAVGVTWFVLCMNTLLCLLLVFARLRYRWSGVFLYGIFLTYLTHLIWALNNPFLGNAITLGNVPYPSVYLIPAYAVIFAVGALFRREPETEDYVVLASALLGGIGSCALFLLVTAVAFESTVVLSNLVAALIFLGLATSFWIREKSRYSTFVYAMLGYTVMSVALLKAFTVPDVFVWLSLQSVVVVATAIWFRSRFIVVANFGIFLLIVLGYLVVAKEESGISLCFGVVALVSARILNWQQDRLELKTEMMRNAYLALAFIVFPYALYHLVPRDLVILSWVGVAGFYYLMNLIIRKQKYRWMGHLTLLLTVLYVLVIGIIQLEPTYRILSFLVLGTALVVVSLVFTRLRARKRTK